MVFKLVVIMIISKDWKDYELIDTSNGEKLERWGEIILRRPDPQIVWNTPMGKEWNKVDGWYHRSNKGGGKGRISGDPPDLGRKGRAGCVLPEQGTV